ncbi:monofunctional biosynthetic peptidoglycan transglycosylase [Nitrospira sp. Kam-Ns4a]
MGKSTRRILLGRLIVLAALLTGLWLAGIVVVWLVTFPDISALVTRNPSTTAVMQARAEAARAAGRRARPAWIWVPRSRISPHLQRAVIVSEDAAFYTHHGFDWKGIRDAAVRNLEAGEIAAGGSTITQQLAKNLYLSPERTWWRKLHEALIVWALEHRLSKPRILELYLNVVEWGDQVYGAEAAARHHFGKPARDLTPEEAALLAAILPSPRRYDPLIVTAYLARRQQQILERMGRN